MRALLTLVGLAALVYALAALLLWRYQSRFVFYPNQPTRVIEATPADVGLRFEDVVITTEDDIDLHGWWVPGAQREAILFLHGNAGNISHRLQSLRLLNALGVGVLIIDYRGYGRSAGEPSEQGTYRDALAAWRHLIEERGLQAGEIIVYGRSLGGAVAAELATVVDPAGAILESTFTSIPDMAQHAFPWLPASLARIRYDTLSKVGRISCPLLILHSPEDEVIPYQHSQRLAAAATASVRFVTLRGAHNDAFLVTGDDYAAALRAFIASVRGRAADQKLY